MAAKMYKIGVLLILLCTGGVFATAQPKTPAPKPAVDAVVPPRERPPRTPPAYPRDVKQTTERSITVDPNVSIKMCVAEGNLKVTGWERNEVRVFVRSGRLPGFKVLEKDASSGKANW